MDTSSIGDLVVDGLVKGVPPGTEPFALRDAGAQGWNVLREDLPLPVAVIRAGALERNERWMTRFVELGGARIAPHGKTTMSPQLFERQLASGAWGITLATVHQVHVARRFRVSRIVLANQLVGARATRYVLDELHADPGFEFHCLVDSEAGVDALGRAASKHPLARPLPVLLEGGNHGGRTGVRDVDAGVAVARRVARWSPHLALAGVEGFEGFIGGADHAAQDDAVRGFVDFLGALARACEDEGLFADGPVLLTAGGSAFYDLVVERFRDALPGRETIVLTRSGCYLTHDSRMYREFFARLRERSADAERAGQGLESALEVWAYVQSRPEPGKAILTLGKRDAGIDGGFPVAERWYRPGEHEAPRPAPPGCEVTELNDQHTHMTVPADSPLIVGDMVAFGVSHPCTTFDRWQVIWTVDDDYDVVGGVRTFF